MKSRQCQEINLQPAAECGRTAPETISGGVYGADMPFTYEKSTGRDGEYIEITGYEGSVRDLVIPGTIDGLPVQRIAGHAFDGREDIEHVMLPESIRQIRAFAFYNCIHLKAMTLDGRVRDYYDGNIRCDDALSLITIRIHERDYSLVKAMMGDSDNLLHFHLVQDDGQVCLTFPSFAYSGREDTHSRAIHFHVEGMGYSYRNCILKKEIRFGEYDQLFEVMQQLKSEQSTAADIAFGRLMYPYCLKDPDRLRYEEFLHGHAEALMEDILENGRVDRLRFMLEGELLPPQDMDAALRQAAGSHNEHAEQMRAMLMEYQKKTEKAPEPQTLTLEDW